MSSRTLRRYGPIAAIVVVIGVVVAVVAMNSGGSSSSTSTTGTTVTGANTFAPEGVLSWSQAKAQGKTASINWGTRCDTSRGRLAYPSFFAGECYAPFTGSNGGATYQGVTPTTIKVVLYLPQDKDPILSFAYG